MGTFGTGPFDSDGACDLLDRLAAYSPDQRAGVLTDVFDRLAADPESLGSEIFADEVMAAVAVIAVSLSRDRAEEPLWRDVMERAHMAAPAAVPPRLASAAIAALAVINEAWCGGWTDPADATAARETAGRLLESLHTNADA